MVMNSKGIYSVPDDRHVPPGALTLGQLVREARREKNVTQVKTREQRAHDKRTARHEGLWHRWSRMALRDKRSVYPKDHPIHRDMLVWERYVCRFAIEGAFSQRVAGIVDEKIMHVSPDDEAAWFDELSELARLDLCDYSREIRRRLALSRTEPDDGEE